MDAFSNDAIPVHLLTKEAFSLYWQHLKPDGVLAVHISNGHLNLSPVVRTLAKEFEKQAIFVTKDGDIFSRYSSDWVLVTSNTQFLDDERVKKRITPWKDNPPQAVLWTDDYSNLASVLVGESGTIYIFKWLFEWLLQYIPQGLTPR